MRIFLLTLLLIPSVVLADEKEDIRLLMEFERMKYRSSYPNDLNKASKEGQLFILWVSCSDPSLYSECKAKFPDAIHSFVESSKLEACSPGIIIIGVRGTESVEQVKALNGLETKGVILTLYSLNQRKPPNSQQQILHSSHTAGYLEVPNMRFR